ncbi:Vacuolar cation/proton exchanger 2, partial [Linum grandiflorum]
FLKNLGLVRGELDSSNSLESGYGNVELARISGQLHLDHSRDNAAVAIAVAGSSWPEFVLRSVCTVLLKARIKVLLPFGPLAIFVNYFYGDPGWVFFLSLLGITPLAERLGYATEQIAYYSGPTVGGLLNATFGNATEMIVSVFALKSGMIRVIQQSLLGSILSNLLMVLGCAFFVGGIVHHDKKVQVFNKAAAAVDCGFLLVSVMGIIIPAVLHATKTEVEIGKSELSLSRFSSCMMLLAYAAYLFFQLKSHQSLYNPINEEDVLDEERHVKEEEVPEITKWEAISWLAILTLWVSVLSGYLVDAIQGASESSHLSMGFINVILIPIAGNSAAYATTIMFAIKDKQDITLGVAIGSSTQIAMFAVRSQTLMTKFSIKTPKLICENC